MTWAVASTVLVVLALGAALRWFERTRPSSRDVAMVAALAALAVAGRIALAPIPSVKPTTDIVLVAGIAFGGLPGFVVGALTALVSNVAFGQGLHTPWQMLAWGLVGVLGGVVGALTGRRLGRWALAVLGAVAALGFSLVMELSTWAQTAPTHGLSDLLAIVARGLPFTAAHVAGSFAFALAFGPAMVTSLTRSRTRAAGSWAPPEPAATARNA